MLSTSSTICSTSRSLLISVIFFKKTNNTPTPTSTHSMNKTEAGKGKQIILLATFLRITHDAVDTNDSSFVVHLFLSANRIKQTQLQSVTVI